MTDDEVKALIARAEAVVGRNPDGNLSLKAEDLAAYHTSQLRDAVSKSLATQAEVAPLLAALEDPSVREVLKRYASYNAEARTAQSTVRRRWMGLVWPVLGALVLAVVLALFPSGKLVEVLKATGLSSATAEQWAFLGPRWFVVLALVMVPLLAVFADPEAQEDAHREARGTAEALRRKLFDVILAAPEPAAAPIPPLLLKLEHFRRYQVEVQTAYYGIRAAEHASTARRADTMRRLCQAGLALWIALCGAAIIGGLGEQASAPFANGIDGPIAAAFAGFNAIEAWEIDYLVLPVSLVMGAGYAILLLKQHMNASRRNAVRYAHAHGNFLDLAKDLAPVRMLAARGGPDGREAVRRYIEKVHSAMSAELADWVRLAALDIGAAPADSAAPAPAASGLAAGTGPAAAPGARA